VSTPPVTLNKSQARRIWLHAQRLDTPAPFGNGPSATPAAIQHLGYVQIDTIHVIERCHHHILYTRIPEYRREHLHQAQTVDKTVFEYWAHALAYLHIDDMRYYVRDMREYTPRPHPVLEPLKEQDVRDMVARIRRNGALTIRDIDDDVLIEKVDAWMSRKPSKRLLQRAFTEGLLTISKRSGMVKTYELMTRHFGWQRLPAAATRAQTVNYLLERALRSQGLVSIESACYMDAPAKPAIARLIAQKARRKELVPVDFAGAGGLQHWARPEALEARREAGPELVHILSPFDPLIIQRKRLNLFFDYQHRFEAYVPKPKRVFGYFACPVLVGEQVVAALDLKTDRERRKLQVQKWTWVGKGSARAHKAGIEAALERFERFQLASLPRLAENPATTHGGTVARYKLRNAKHS
jgi:uncharacterized protein